MNKHDEVKAFFVALASFGDEAERIIDSLQPGHGFAPQPSELAGTFRAILLITMSQS